MWFFKKKFQRVQVGIYPLNGIGKSRKETLKFLKKFFKKSGNYQGVVNDITACRTAGVMYIHSEVSPRIARKLQSSSEKYGITVKLLDQEYVYQKKLMNTCKHFQDKNEPWVYSTY